MESIIEKIRKLMQMTTENGCSEAEMNNALARAQRLMLEHNLSEDLIEVCETDIKEEHINSEPPCYEPRDFEWNLLDLIANNYMCQTLRSSKYDDSFNKKYYYRLIGSDENRRVVMTLFKGCQNLFRLSMHTRYEEYCKNSLSELNNNEIIKSLDIVYTLGEARKKGFIVRKSNWIPSYLKGCLEGLKSKLNSEFKDVINDESSNNQYALVKVKHDALIQEYISKKIKNVKSVNTDRGSLFVPSAYNEGIKDGFSNQNLKRLS